MEFLAQSLEGYKDIVGNAALITTVAQFFSPAFICYDIKKQGNTDNIPVVPFLGGLMMYVYKKVKIHSESHTTIMYPFNILAVL